MVISLVTHQSFKIQLHMFINFIPCFENLTINPRVQVMLQKLMNFIILLLALTIVFTRAGIVKLFYISNFSLYKNIKQPGIMPLILYHCFLFVLMFTCLSNAGAWPSSPRLNIKCMLFKIIFIVPMSSKCFHTPASNITKHFSLFPSST